jgi:two-component system OmpR family response regulator
MAAPTETPDHLLIVDDDPQLVELLDKYLSDEGFRVSRAFNATQMRAVMANAKVHLVLLDLMLPKEDGLSICRSLRANGATAVPILMLSARSDETDRVLGLEMGADDYLTKPFARRELLARIRAILRRTRQIPLSVDLPAKARVLKFGTWQLDTTSRHLVDETETIVPLTGGEYRLLSVLLSHPQRVLSRDDLLNLTQGREADPLDRSIDLLISRLRRRLREDPREPRYIKTVRSGGYVFSEAVHPIYASGHENLA